MPFNINHTTKGNKRGVIEEKRVGNVKYKTKKTRGRKNWMKLL